MAVDHAYHARLVEAATDTELRHFAQGAAFASKFATADGLSKHEETGEFTAATERIVLPPRPAAVGDVPTNTKPKRENSACLLECRRVPVPWGRAVVLVDRSVGLSLAQCGHDETIYSFTSSARAKIDGGMVRVSVSAVREFIMNSGFDRPLDRQVRWAPAAQPDVQLPCSI